MNAPRYNSLDSAQVKSRKHGVRMLGRITKCWLFTYRAPEAEIRKYVPEPLEPVTFGGFGFWNMVACEVSQLRPWPLPAIAGIRYQHIAYRIHVRAPGFSHPDQMGEPEGLYFLRSDCDSALIHRAGNLMTDLKLHRSKITLPSANQRGFIRLQGDQPAEIEVDPMLKPELSWLSPFDSVSEAASFLKYKPMALSPNGQGGVRAMRINREESDWKAKPIGVRFADWSYLPDDLNSGLEVCYAVDPIDYDWTRSVDLIRSGRF